MHDLADLHQAGAELPAWMEGAEMVRREAARLQERDGQRIADDKLQQRRRRRRKPVRAGFRHFAAGSSTMSASRASAESSPAVTAISGMAKRRE